MCVCVCIQIYIYMYTYIYMYIYVYIYVTPQANAAPAALESVSTTGIESYVLNRVKGWGSTPNPPGTQSVKGSP